MLYGIREEFVVYVVIPEFFFQNLPSIDQRFVVCLAFFLTECKSRFDVMSRGVKRTRLPQQPPIIQNIMSKPKYQFAAHFCEQAQAYFRTKNVFIIQTERIVRHFCFNCHFIECRFGGV